MLFGTRCWVEGRSARRVAREMGVSRNTVKRYLAQAAPTRVERVARGRPVWEKAGARLEGLLAESPQWTGGKQRLTATRLHAMLVGEGLTIGVTTVKAAVAEWKRRRREVFVPLVYPAGDLAEVDFFEVSFLSILLAGVPANVMPGGSVSERRLVHFPSGVINVATNVASGYHHCVNVKARLSASVDAVLIAAAEKAVSEGRSGSVSGWVNDALQLKVEEDRRLRALGAFVEEYEAEHGAIMPEEIEAATRRARAAAVVVRPAHRTTGRRSQRHKAGT